MIKCYNLEKALLHVYSLTDTSKVVSTIYKLERYLEYGPYDRLGSMMADIGHLALSLSCPKRCKCDSATKGCKCDKTLQMRQCDGATKRCKCDSAIKGCKCDKTLHKTTGICGRVIVLGYQ